jgi:hypothetical protein
MIERVVQFLLSNAPNGVENIHSFLDLSWYNYNDDANNKANKTIKKMLDLFVFQNEIKIIKPQWVWTLRASNGSRNWDKSRATGAIGLSTPILSLVDLSQLKAWTHEKFQVGSNVNVSDLIYVSDVGLCLVDKAGVHPIGKDHLLEEAYKTFLDEEIFRE